MTEPLHDDPGAEIMPPMKLAPSETLRQLYKLLAENHPRVIVHSIAFDPVLHRTAWMHYPGNPELESPDRDYLERFQHRDRRVKILLTHSGTDWISEREVFDEEFKRHSPIYNEFLRPLDAVEFVARSRHLGGVQRLFTNVIFLGGRRADPRLLNAIRRYEIASASVAVRRAAVRRFGLDATTGASSVLLEDDRLRLFVTDRDGRLVHASAMAQAMLAAGDVLLVRDGRLRAANALSDRLLEASLAEPFAPPEVLNVPDEAHVPSQDETPGRVILARELGGRLRCVIRIVPDPHTADHLQIFVADLVQRPRRAADLPEDPFRLTAAERRVAAAIAAGRPAAEICLLEGWAPATLHAVTAAIRDKAAAVGAGWSDVVAVFMP